MSDSNSSLPETARLRVFINQIDHVMIPPGSLDHSTLPQVPLLRIFGPSSRGKNACVHVHQVYPYFLVEYQEKLDTKSVNKYIAKLTSSLNHAIALSLKRDPKSYKSRYIRAILLVKGIHFYGFHTSYSPFLKILIADPTYVYRAVTIMRSGSIMSTSFRIFESHLSYVLQFMCDFGLYGCGAIDLEDCLQRCTEGAEQESQPQATFLPSPCFRQSRMPLEVDVIAPQILNRHRILARKLHHKLEIPAPVSTSEPLVIGVRELWDDERKRRLAQGFDPSPEMPIDPSASSREKGGDWVAEARWWEELRHRITSEPESINCFDLQKQEPSNWENQTMSVFESIEALWEKQWKVWKLSKTNSSDQNFGEQSRIGELQNEENERDDVKVDVDFSMLSNEEISALENLENPAGLHEGNEYFQDDENFDDAYEGDEVPQDELPVQTEDSGDISDGSSQDLFLNSEERVTTVAEEHAVYRLPSPPGPCLPDPESILHEPLTPTRRTDWTTQTSLRSLATREDSSDQKLELTSSPESVNDSLRPTLNQMQSPELNAMKVRKKLKHHHHHDGSFALLKTPHSPIPSTVQIINQPPSIMARSNFLSRAFTSCNTVNNNRYIYHISPPSTRSLLDSLDVFNLPRKIYRSPYYSYAGDAPENPREYAGLSYHLKSNTVKDLDEWIGLHTENGQVNVETIAPAGFSALGTGGWEFASAPPSVREVKRWLLFNKIAPQNTSMNKSHSQVEGPTQTNIYGFKTSPVATNIALSKHQNMSILSLEVFAPTLDNKTPDPNINEIVAVFYAYHISGEHSTKSGVFATTGPQFAQLRFGNIDLVQNELDLINRAADLVVDLDPDVIVGWEVQNSSWGFLNARAQEYGLDIVDFISRAPPRYQGGKDQWGARNNSTFKVPGRHVLNLWRIMRGEQTLTSYTLENVAFNVLHRRVPKYSYLTLTEWYYSSIPARCALLFRYFSSRTAMNLEILEKSDVITKTAEFARVFGVDFFSVISRGSQFKVESFMFRIAKPESFVLISPSKNDVGKQNAAECMPLILEPMSAFYSSPLVVLDFQSLYPSIMIAYNYCYSTCLGRISNFQGRNKFGVVDLDLPEGLLKAVEDHITVAPNGMMYVKPVVRKGLLGRMLVELLDTRVMVKQAMKRLQNDRAMKRILDARQLGLKYIANVTYGYTSASYSGRMPAVEIADSIVQSGRETLEKAIELINSNKRWGATVVYGDTDSVFVYLPGKTKDQAFRIGNEMADAITIKNPAPVKMKFEKVVYLPCVLMAKKRYVGFKYEYPDEKEPTFDAKGIETVRRDGVLAQRKMTENCLKILFRSQDLTAVKDYCYDSWSKLLENRAPVQDFIFAKEVRMGTYSDKVPPPPGVVVAARRMLNDPGREPQYGERIPYVIVRGSPGARLVDRAIDPLDLINDSHKQLDATYYISRVLIPPLERIFNLVGVDIRQWYTEMPKIIQQELVSPSKAKSTDPLDRLNINAHFRSTQCVVCSEYASEVLCDECRILTQNTQANIASRLRHIERRLLDAHLICISCTSSNPSDPVACESLDCTWFYTRKKAERRLEEASLMQQISHELELEDVTKV